MSMALALSRFRSGASLGPKKIGFLRDGSLVTGYPKFLDSLTAHIYQLSLQLFEEVVIMAGGVNKVILIGRLGSDPEVRYTTSGGAVANFNVATNESWVDKAGQKQERTEWHKVVVWGKLAEICGQYLTKGRQAFIEGRLQTREWVDKEGGKRYTTEIVAQNVQFLGAGQDRGQPAASSFAPSSEFVPSEDKEALPPDEEVPF